MRARIHRAAAEVGGNCVELEAGETRLVLDVGSPITARQGEDERFLMSLGWQTV